MAEWIRNQAAAGATIWSEEMDAVEGMMAIRDALDAKEAGILRGYTPEARGRYMGQGNEADRPIADMTDEELRELAGVL